MCCVGMGVEIQVSSTEDSVSLFLYEVCSLTGLPGHAGGLCASQACWFPGAIVGGLGTK